MKRRRSRALGLVIGLSVAAAFSSAAWSAAAKPSIWARARNPQLRRQARAMAQADSLLLESAELNPSDLLSRPRLLVLKRAYRQLLKVGAAQSANPQLRYRLGRVLYELYEVDGQRQYLERAVGHFEYAGQRSRAISHRADAYHQLGVCFAHLRRHRDEVIANTKALALEPHAETRALLLANRAEAFMAIGELSAAIDDYRRSLATTPAHALHRYGVTTWWGLAVALDRSGDLAGGLEQLRYARSYDPNDRRLRSEGWFFVPPYDGAWYAALGHWQDARTADNRTTKLAALLAAIEAWERYLDRAPASDRWVKLASLRHDQCEREYRRTLAESKQP